MNARTVFVSSTQLLLQTQHFPQQDQPTRGNKNRNTQKNKAHISSGTRNSKNQHKFMQEKTPLAVIKQHCSITPSATIKTFNILS
jgi:hypothetical protein